MSDIAPTSAKPILPKRTRTAIYVAAGLIIFAFFFLKYREQTLFAYSKLTRYKWFWIMPLVSLGGIVSCATGKRTGPISFIAGFTPFCFQAVLTVEAMRYGYMHDSSYSIGAYVIFFSGVILVACSGSAKVIAGASSAAKAWLPTRKAEILKHDVSVVHNFEMSSKEFYQAVTNSLTEQRIPGLSILPIEFFESTFLFAKRSYLRIVREEMVFDICAAPFGKHYFFSIRSAQFPRQINPMSLFALVLGTFVYISLLVQILGVIFGLLTAVAIAVGAFWFLRSTIASSFANLDSTLVKDPIVGPLYDRFIRRKTYFREDSRVVGLQIITGVVQETIEDAVAKNGVKLINLLRHDALLDQLYKRTQVQLDDKVVEPPLTKAA